MAKYVTDSEFKRLVRVCLDQNMSSEALAALEDVDTLSLDEIIDSKAEDAALTVVRIAPIDKLGDVAQSLEGALSIAGGEPHKGVIQLPLDFERLVRFKMSSWQYAVFTALPPLPPLYIEANSEFGVCGTKDRPLVFLVPSTENGKDLCLEIFSAKNTDDVLDGCLYIARPKKRVIGSDGSNQDDNGSNYYYSGAIGHFDDDDNDDDNFISCAEASELGSALDGNATTTETYSVVGYITEIEGEVSNGKQSFWMADTLDGGYVIEATNAILPEDVETFEEGMRVIVTGRLNKYVDDGPAVIGIDEGTVVILDSGSNGNSGNNGGGDDYYYYDSIGHWDDEDHDVPEYVDLGLPSGTLWATKNIGGAHPEDSGEYFSWGETEPKETYFWPDYLFGNGASNSISKYNANDGKTELDADDDAATVRLGSCWQTPTRSQLWELVGGQYTSVVWTMRKGVCGHLITSKENGNSIFLPASGEMVGSSIEGAGTYGKYWSRTLNFGSNTNINDACILHTLQNGCGMGHIQRYTGLCVRPVYVPSTPLGRKKKPRIDEESVVVRPDADASGTVVCGDTWKMLLGERLLMPTVYYAAYLTALAVKDDKAAEKLLGVAKSLMER